MNKTIKIIVELLLLVGIAALVYANYSSIMKPVNFNKEKNYRQGVAVQRLKDIRTLQVAYKAVNNKFTASFDTLADFYNKAEMSVIMQVGSEDDSLAMAHTAAIKKANPKLKGAELNNFLFEKYQQGDKQLVFSVENKIPVRDTIFHSRQDFCVDSLRYIPFSGGMETEMEAIVRTVSGVQVPLFEARMPYKKLLHGLDNQLRINLDAEMRDMNRYEGLQVGSVTAPNNNAGNWE